eukprot:TRINITY_DN2532_c0_g1_i4.p1 TRINITY_DN2532_c0_g1~~TRINITY_DN2532_c0_g1_i4.p1  ORF type:complete len:448 (-),score=110.33 TRINITY_DN2532_c0_g1_i4:55-1398(-)
MSTSLLTKSAAPPVISQPSSQFAPYFNNPQFNDTELVLVSSAEPPAKRQRISYNEASPCGTSTDTDNEDGAETKSVWVSKIILASHGEYWERLFSNGMRETTAKAITIEVPAHEQAAFIDMIRFMYTGQLQADTDANVIDVIIQADKFQASKVIGECARVLADKITSFESCLRYFELLATVGQCEALQRLRDRCTSFIVEYFIDFEQMFHQQEKMDQFKILDKQGVESIFRSDDLKVMSENSVFHALMVWVEHDLPNREADVADLMRHVRLPLMSLGFLRDCVASQPLVCKLPSVQEELIEALAYCGFCKDRRKWHRRTVAADRTHFYQKRHLIPVCSLHSLCALSLYAATLLRPVYGIVRRAAVACVFRLQRSCDVVCVRCRRVTRGSGEIGRILVGVWQRPLDEDRRFVVLGYDLPQRLLGVSIHVSFLVVAFKEQCGFQSDVCW